MKTKLYIIKKYTQEQYWTCSTEHSTGWATRPKQAFSPSELTREIRRLIDNDWWCDCTIIELYTN